MIVLLLLTLFPNRVDSAQANSVRFTIGEKDYTVNGVVRHMDVAPYIKNGRAFLPVRYTALGLGIPESGIIWDPILKTVTLIKGSRVIQMKLGSNKMQLNGMVLKMDTAPEIRNDRVMLPLRFAAEALGSSVDWDPVSQVVTLSDNSPLVEQPPALAHSGDLDIKYRWTYQGEKYTWDLPLSRDEFNQELGHFQRKDHPQLTLQDPFYYVDTYTNDPDDDQIITSVVDELRRIARKEGFSQYETVEFVISFVQGFPYISDSDSTGYDEYPRYPVETLLERCGDCEDTAILAGVLLNEMGYGTALLVFRGDPGHAALGIYGGRGVTGTYFLYGGKRYFYVETTDAGWPIGKIPSELEDQTAIVLPLE